jgi:hypothetical protein
VQNTIEIWRFTLVLIKINYGQIGDQTGLFYTGQSVWWKPMFFRTELIFTGFVRRTGMFGIHAYGDSGEEIIL